MQSYCDVYVHKSLAIIGGEYPLAHPHPPPPTLMKSCKGRIVIVIAINYARAGPRAQYVHTLNRNI